jgi:predicted ATP-dependent endonuclease of OLD family
MRINKIRIQSFRSIGYCELSFEKRDEVLPDLWLFVGENNSGKTTTLKALEILIGEKSIHPEVAVKSNSLHDYNNNMNWVGQKQVLEIGIDFEYKSHKYQLNNRWRLDQHNNKNLSLVDNAYAANLPYGKLLMIEPKEENYKKHLTLDDETNDYRILGLIKEQLHINSSNASPIEKCITSLSDSLKSSLNVIAGVLDVEIDPDCDSDAYLEIRINDGTFAPAMEKAPGLQRLVLLSLLEWLATQEYSILRDYIIGLDEPESHLHPQSIKNVVRRIKELSKHVQIIATTHSPYFIYQVGISNVIRVVNEEQSAQFFGLPVISYCLENDNYDYSEKNRIKVQEKLARVFSNNLINDLLKRPILHNERSINSLFSKFVLIVEGESEEVYIPSLFQVWRENLFKEWFDNNTEHIMDELNISSTHELQNKIPRYFDELDIHIVSIGGKFQLTEFVLFLLIFNISFHAIIDNDSTYSKIQLNSQDRFFKQLKNFLYSHDNIRSPGQFKNLKGIEDYLLNLEDRNQMNHMKNITIIGEHKKKYEIEDIIIELVGMTTFTQTMFSNATKQELIELNLQNNFDSLGKTVKKLNETRKDSKKKINERKRATQPNMLHKKNQTSHKVNNGYLTNSKVEMGLTIIKSGILNSCQHHKINHSGLGRVFSKIVLQHLERGIVNHNPRIKGDSIDTILTQ